VCARRFKFRVRGVSEGFRPLTKSGARCQDADALSNRHGPPRARSKTPIQADTPSPDFVGRGKQRSPIQPRGRFTATGSDEETPKGSSSQESKKPMSTLPMSSRRVIRASENIRDDSTDLRTCSVAALPQQREMRFHSGIFPN